MSDTSKPVEKKEEIQKKSAPVAQPVVEVIKEVVKKKAARKKKVIRKVVSYSPARGAAVLQEGDNIFKVKYYIERRSKLERVGISETSVLLVDWLSGKESL